MRGNLVRYAIVALAAAASATGAGAATVQITPVADNTLFEDPTGALSNGAGERLFTGTTAVGDLRRAVLTFDIAGSVPLGADINSVELTMQMSKTISGDKTVSLHRLLADWGEGTADAPGEEGTGTNASGGDATWLHTFSPSQFWLMPGGDFEVVASAATPVGAANGPYTWSSPAMVADAEDWLADPSGNFGWIVIGDESDIASAKRFDSRESANPPLLTITYDEGDPVPASSPLSIAALVLGLACGSLAVLRRRAA